MKLSQPEKEVIICMKQGQFLIKRGQQELVCPRIDGTGNLIKAGTIQRLLDEELIEVSPITDNVYRLSNQGRFLRF